MKALIPLECGSRRVACLSLSVSAWLLFVHPCAGSPGYFVETGSLNTARYGHTATLLPNGKVLVAGGVGTSGVELGSVELYDPESGTWTFTGSLVNARDSHTATWITD